MRAIPSAEPIRYRPPEHQRRDVAGKPAYSPGVIAPCHCAFEQWHGARIGANSPSTWPPPSLLHSTKYTWEDASDARLRRDARHRQGTIGTRALMKQLCPLGVGSTDLCPFADTVLLVVTANHMLLVGAVESDLFMLGRNTGASGGDAPWTLTRRLLIQLRFSLRHGPSFLKGPLLGLSPGVHLRRSTIPATTMRCAQHGALRHGRLSPPAFLSSCAW